MLIFSVFFQFSCDAEASTKPWGQLTIYSHEHMVRKGMVGGGMGTVHCMDMKHVLCDVEQGDPQHNKTVIAGMNPACLDDAFVNYIYTY